jgi:hypothetical protein
MLTHPKAISREVHRFEHALGITPEVQTGETGHWCLIASTLKVRFEVGYKRKTSTNIRRAERRLLVNGEERDVPDKDCDIVALFREHAEHDELGPARLASAPTEVKKSYNTTRRQLGDQVDIQLLNGLGSWVIHIQFPRGELSFFFDRAHSDDWRLACKPLQLVVDSVDRTAEAEGNMRRALGIVATTIGGTTETPLPIKGAAQAARSNSVETRRMVVLRE